MPCYHPIRAYYSREKTESGKRKLVFEASKAYDSGHQVTIPCGRCIGCRLERSRQWAVRCLFEAQLYDENCFITLTYDDEHLIDDSLHKRDFQLFIKKLRRSISPRKLRYYHAGEYGELTNRPHYHACLFGYSPDDKVYWSMKNGNKLYTSEKISKIWGKGYVVIGDITFESAAYISRYINKKLLSATEEEKEEHYHGRETEYSTMSRRPGIGQKFLEKFKSDVYPGDYVVVRGKKMKPPKYFDEQLKKNFPEMYKEVKEKREKNSGEMVPKHLLLMGYPSMIKDGSQERLDVKEEVKRAFLKNAPRKKI